MLKLTDALQAPEMYATCSNVPKLQVNASYAPGRQHRPDQLLGYLGEKPHSPGGAGVVGGSGLLQAVDQRTLVGSRTSGGPKPYTEEGFKLSASLRAGWNLIVFKHGYPQLGPVGDPDPNTLNTYFSLRFVWADTLTPVTNLVASFDPDPSCDDRAPLRTTTYTRVLIPSLAHLPGVGGSQWRSDLELYNGTHMSWEARVNHYREGSNGNAAASRAVTLGPFEASVFTNALHSSELFGLAENQKGYAWINGGYYCLLKYAGAKAKVYNQAPSGTFGMEVRSFPSTTPPGVVTFSTCATVATAPTWR